jgi:DNA-binding HxlR family transcriptional regulator
LIVLEKRTLRFSELRRTIGGVSERMLAQTLQWLEEDGMVNRKAFQVVPPHVEYSLTPLGKEAAEKVRLLADWIETSVPRIVGIWKDRNDFADTGGTGDPEDHAPDWIPE